MVVSRSLASALALPKPHCLFVCCRLRAFLVAAFTVDAALASGSAAASTFAPPSDCDGDVGSGIASAIFAARYWSSRHGFTCRCTMNLRARRRRSSSRSLRDSCCEPVFAAGGVGKYGLDAAATAADVKSVVSASAVVSLQLPFARRLQPEMSSLKLWQHHWYG